MTVVTEPTFDNLDFSLVLYQEKRGGRFEVGAKWGDGQGWTCERRMVLESKWVGDSYSEKVGKRVRQ